MPTSISDLIRAEELHNQIVLNTRGTIRTRFRTAAEKSLPVTPPQVAPEAQELPPGFISAPVSASTYRLIWREATAHPMGLHRVMGEHIDEARSYVQDLFDVDLGRVRVEIVPRSQWDDHTAEATTKKEGVDSHLIFIPDFCDCPPSELLVHEFAHAGHFAAQRQNNEIEYFWSFPATKEFAAHFCQYNFLLERRPRADFMHAMGQFVMSTYALAILSANALSSFESFIQSEQGQAIQEGWPMAELVSTFELFQRNQSFFIDEWQRGIAQMLSLLLIDEREGMRRFIRLDRIDQDLGTKLAVAFPEVGVLDAFPQINAQVASLLKRFTS